MQFFKKFGRQELVVKWKNEVNAHNFDIWDNLSQTREELVTNAPT